MNKNEYVPQQTRFTSQPPTAMFIRGRKGRSNCWIVQLFILLQKIGNILAAICTFQPGKDSFPVFRPPPSSVPSFFTSIFSTQELAQPNATNPFLLPKCSCESDWANAFCARIEIYAQMEEEKAPSVCVCRQMIGVGECRQFLSRCFRRSPQSPSTPPLTQQFPQQHRPLVKLDEDDCDCCFNQPDQFCNQLDCHKMRPKFDSPNIDCRCFLPQTTQIRPGEYPPEHICQGNDAMMEGASLSQHLPMGIDQENEEFILPFSSSSSSSSRPPPKSTSSNLARIFRSNAPYARFVSFLLFALLASVLLAVLVCFWSHWRRIRRGRRKAKVEAEQPVTSTSQLNGEEEEILRGTTATNEGGRRIGNGGENGTVAPLIILQEATV